MKQRTKSKRKLLSVLSLACACCLATGAFSLSAASAASGSYEITPTYVDNNFTIIDRDTETELDTTMAKEELSFINITQSLETMLISKTKLTAPYSVEFSMFSNTGGYPDGVFVLGHDDYNVGGMGIQSGGGLYIDRSAGAIVPWQGAKLYQPDGTTEVTGNFMQLPEELGAWAVNQELLFKFDVQANGHVNVYYDFATTENPLTTLRKIIKPADGADLDITKEGYFVFAPRVEAADITANCTKRTVQYIKENDTKTVFSGEINTDKWNIAGNAEKAIIAKDFGFVDANNTTVASNFKYTTEGLTNANDVVFDITFRSERRHAATSPTWGLAFGMESQEDDIAQADRFEMGVTALRVYKGAAAQDNTNGAAYITNIYNTGADVTVRLVGRKDGTLEEYRAVTTTNKIEDLYTTYTGLDFNGYVAFYSRAGADSAAGDTVNYRAISMKGNVEMEVKSLSLIKGALDAAVTGTDITLQSEIVCYPDINTGVTYSIVSGGDKCTLNGNVLSITKAGEITVRVTSNDDDSVYDEYTFTAKDLVFERYMIKEGFTSLNEADWAKYDTDGNITVDEGLYFKGDNKTETGGSAALVSNVYFMTSPDEDTIFDISFTSGLLSAATFRDPAYSWGLIFGMKNHNARAGDAGVGYIKVDFNHTFVFNGATEVQPVYATDRVSNAGDVFFENPYDITIRAVGKNDGTLELYRGYSVYESASTLFATYAGLDFTGYVALTTDSSNSGTSAEDYQVRFTDVSLEGNVCIDGNYEIKNVVIDESVFADAIVSEIPLDVSVKVNAVPNLNYYGGYTLEVVSGNATFNENKLTVTGEGEIKIKATSTLDTTVFKEYTFTATELKITDIVWNESLFTGLNSDSQPVQLSAAVECNMLANKYQSLVWTVESGNAEIVLDQLRITGAGHVVLKVKTVYGGFEKTVEFDVAAVNDGEHNPVINDKGETDSGCTSEITAGAFILPVILAAAAVVLKKRKAQIKNK